MKITTEPNEEMVEDLGESTVVAGGHCYQLGTHPGSADVHIREGYMILRCEAEYVVESKDGAITFGLNGDDIARLLEVLARSGNLPSGGEDLPEGPWDIRHHRILKGDYWQVWNKGRPDEDFDGTEVECIAVRDALNRLKAIE